MNMETLAEMPVVENSSNEGEGYEAKIAKLKDFEISGDIVNDYNSLMLIADKSGDSVISFQAAEDVFNLLTDRKQEWDKQIKELQSGDNFESPEVEVLLLQLETAKSLVDHYLDVLYPQDNSK